MYSNNVRDQNGESIIPASQRPDGTWRKARRVKEGYVPQEEVPLYESKGKQFITMQQKKEPIKLPTGHIAHPTIPGLFIEPEKEKTKSKNKKKNKKVEEVTKEVDKIKISEPKVTKVKTEKSDKLIKSTNVETSTEPIKKLKNLKKRLREVEALEEKLKKGEITKPEPEQLAKVKRKNDLLLQIKELEKEISD